MKKLYLILTILVLSACSAGSYKLNVVPYPNDVKLCSGEFCPMGASIKCDPEMDSASVKIAEDFPHYSPPDQQADKPHRQSAH